MIFSVALNLKIQATNENRVDTKFAVKSILAIVITASCGLSAADGGTKSKHVGRRPKTYRHSEREPVGTTEVAEPITTAHSVGNIAGNKR